MKQGELFPPPELELDSCILAACRAEERLRRYCQAVKEEQNGQQKEHGYVATDDDLPAIFWEPRP